VNFLTGTHNAGLRVPKPHILNEGSRNETANLEPFDVHDTENTRQRHKPSAATKFLKQIFGCRNNASNTGLVKLAAFLEQKR